MALSTDVKWITNTMRGAPAVNGNTPGCLIAALDALLVTGWGATTALSVSVSGGIATATVNAGSSFAEHAVVLVDGATPASLNGEARVLTASNTQITFATTAPDGVATGTITIKYAPAGWEKPFAGASKAVYRSADVTGARFYLRVDDSNNLFARVRGFEAMSDVDTGTGLFPPDAHMTGGGYWHKAVGANATAIPYLLAADAKLLLQAICHGVSSSAANTITAVYGFGEGLPINPAGDAYATVLSASGSTGNNPNYGALSGATADGSTQGGAWFARGLQGLGGAVYARPVPESGSASALSGNDSTFGYGPGRVDGAVKMARMLLKEQGNPGELRSVVPGCYFVPQALDNSLFATPFALTEGAGDLAGRRLAAVFTGSSYSVRNGTAFVDVTGPWR